MHRDPLELGVDAHRGDRLADQLVERHALERPADVTRLQTRELEQIVDQRAERDDVGSHPLQVLAARLAVDDLVLDGLGEQTQRRDRGAEIV